MRGKNTKHSTALLEIKLEPQFNSRHSCWAALEMDSTTNWRRTRAIHGEYRKRAKVWRQPQLGGFHLEPVLGCAGTNIIFSHGSIISFKGAAIVNAANTGCIGGAGVDGAINEAGGKALRRARRALPIVKAPLVRCETGDAKMTTSGDLQCTFVIHAVGPNYHSASQATRAFDTLYSAFRPCARLVRPARPRLLRSRLASTVRRSRCGRACIGLLFIGGAYANLSSAPLRHSSGD